MDAIRLKFVSTVLPEVCNKGVEEDAAQEVDFVKQHGWARVPLNNVEAVRAFLVGVSELL
jgi:hypothetical protein